MREIEIKARVKDRDTVMKKLTIIGCVFGEPVVQKDTVYARNVGSLEAYNNNNVYLRIRIKDNGKAFFTAKKPISGLDKLEHETEITKSKEMHEAILLMGFKEAVKVHKSRITTEYNGCEICIDEVEGLGLFIEMEKMGDGDADAIQKELFDFFKSLGVEEKDRIHVGYDILMFQR